MQAYRLIALLSLTESRKSCVQAVYRPVILCAKGQPKHRCCLLTSFTCLPKAVSSITHVCNVCLQELKECSQRASSMMLVDKCGRAASSPECNFEASSEQDATQSQYLQVGIKSISSTRSTAADRRRLRCAPRLTSAWFLPAFSVAPY